MTIHFRPHQQEDFERTKDFPAYARLWEMRVGKTYPTIATAHYQFLKGTITTVLLVAPNGVHLNWSRKAIPEMNREVSFPNHILEWSSAKSGTKGFQAEMEKALAFNGLLWVCVNVEAIMIPTKKQPNKKTFAFLETLVKKRPTFLICDESHKLKDPQAKRTKAALRLSKFCPIKQNLTGTLVPKGPFDIWSQFNILDPNILHDLTSDGKKVPMSFTAFKNHYGIFKPMRFGSGPVFNQLDESQGDHGYKNLEQLYQQIAPYSSRLRQKDVMDVPDIVGGPTSENPSEGWRYFEMSPAQRKVYNELKNDLRTQLANGVEITASQAVVCLLRLQQISRGFVGDGETTHDLGESKPSVDALLDILDQVDGKVIIWCHFRADVDILMTTLGAEAVRYDGQVPINDRPAILERFQTDPSVRYIVGTPACGGMGIDLSAAKTTVFYSYDYNLVHWLQAIARMQGMNQVATALAVYVLIGADSTDEKCIAAIDRKEDLAATVMGDKLKDILS